MPPFLGQARYPGGYTASVTGGGIASKRKASLLRVVACPGRRNVSVTVKPAGAGGRNHSDCRVKTRKKRRR